MFVDEANFTSYTKEGFDRKAQLDLKFEVDRLTDIGAKVLISNSDTEYINDLYSNYNIIHIEANRSINSRSAHRKEGKEVLIKNY